MGDPVTDRPRTSKLSLTALLIPVAGWLATLPVLVVLAYVGATGQPLDGWQLTVVGVGYLGTIVVAALGVSTSLGAALRVHLGGGEVRGRTFSAMGCALSLLLAGPSVLSTLAFAALIWIFVASGGGPHGRPLRVRGRALAGAVRLAARSGGARDVRAALAWARNAVAERSAAAAFDGLADDLAWHGAPDKLITRCRAAAGQERDHTARCLGLVERFGGLVLHADAPAAPERPRATLEELAVSSLADGVVGEGFAAAMAREAAATCPDPAVAGDLDRIARDEAGHAALSADILAWCLQVGGASVRGAVAGARLPGAPVIAASRPIAGGVPGARRRALHAEAVAVARTWQATA